MGTEPIVQRSPILGLPVDIISIEDLLTIMGQWIHERDRTHWIACTNSHGLMEALRDDSFRRVLESADLSIPDGYRLAKIARRRGLPGEQITGRDLVGRFCEFAAPRGYRSYFYGDTEEVLEKMVENLTVRYPGLQVVGTLSPPFRALSDGEEAELIDRVNAAKPDVLWVGLGLPKQERWIARNQQRLRVPVVAAVGAAFKFHSGAVQQAPDWMVRNGFEWVWRTAQEPRRLFRRVVILGPPFLVNVALERYGLKNFGYENTHSGRIR